VPLTMALFVMAFALAAIKCGKPVTGDTACTSITRKRAQCAHGQRGIWNCWYRAKLSSSIARPTNRDFVFIVLRGRLKEHLLTVE
jgi:hypothetical protein